MSVMNDDYCVIRKIDFSDERILQILERRFKANSSQVSFDFKAYRPERPANNAKVTRSLLRFIPKRNSNESNDYDMILSSSSSSSDEDEDDNDDKQQRSYSRRNILSVNDNDYLNDLAEWTPGNFRNISPVDDSDYDDQGTENIFQSVQMSENLETNSIEDMDHSIEILNNSVEDLIVTFEHRPVAVKTEPMQHDRNSTQNMFQLDGQVDVTKGSISNKRKGLTSDETRLNEVIARVQANNPAPQGPVLLHAAPPKPKRMRRETVRKSKQFVQPLAKPSTPVKNSPRKDRTVQSKTKPRKIQAPLYQSLMKANEDAIRSNYPHILPGINAPKVIEKKKSNDRISATKTFTTKSSLTSNSRHSFSESPSSSPMKKPVSCQSSTINREKSTSTRPNAVVPKKTDQSKSTIPLKISQINKTSQQTNPNSKKMLKPSDKKQVQLDRSDPIFERSLPILSNQKKKTKRKELKRLNSEKIDLLAQGKSSNSSSVVEKKRKTDSIVSSPEYILIDDDDENEIEEIEKQSQSISYNISTRDDHLCYSVRSSSMRIQWLINLEYLLLEHILICHANKHRPNSIRPKFIAMIIEKFVKMFILGNNSTDEENFSFLQFSLTSHLRYVLLELPMSNHQDENDEKYVSTLKNLFDLLFDLIELDLCEMTGKKRFRSSLIEDEVFGEDFRSKSSTNRIRLVIYFIELVAIHLKKRSNRNVFQLKTNENFENFLQNLFETKSSNEDFDERLAICFNAIELSLLFVDDQQKRIDEISKILQKFAEQNSKFFKTILFNKHLLVEIRLTIITCLSKKHFDEEIFTTKKLKKFFDKINTIEPNESTLVFLRAFFNTFADWISETKNDKLVVLLGNQLDKIFLKILEISQDDSLKAESLTEMAVFFRLLRCRWTRLSK